MKPKNEAASPLQGANRNTEPQQHKVTKFLQQTIEVDVITFALFVMWVFTLIAAIR